MKKCLILESNEEFAVQLSRALGSEYEVVGVTDDGAEGLRIAERENPTVIVMSLLTKNLDGLSLIGELKKRKVRSELIVSGNVSDDAIINRIMSAGARYYFVKPVSAEIVCERIREIVDGNGADSAEPVERRRAGSVEERISNIFISIGIPPHIKGYRYLREGIRMAVVDPHVINNVTKVLYPQIGEKYATSASKVERAIRHAIEVAWNRGRIDAINSIFGARVYLGTEKPTNSEFIALVADKLILDGLS